MSDNKKENKLDSVSDTKEVKDFNSMDSKNTLKELPDNSNVNGDFFVKGGTDMGAALKNALNLSHLNQKPSHLVYFTDAESNIEPKNSPTIINLLKHDILLTAYRKNPQNDEDNQFNEKVENIYKNWFHQEIDPNEAIKPTFLINTQDQMRLASFKIAANEVANALSLNLVLNPSTDYQVSKNDLLLMNLECASENSTVVFSPIPKKENNNPNQIEDLLVKHIENLKHSSVGLLIIDNFSDATKKMQDFISSIIEKNAYQDTHFENCYLGLMSEAKNPALLGKFEEKCHTFEVNDLVFPEEYKVASIKNKRAQHIGVPEFNEEFSEKFAKQVGHFSRIYKIEDDDKESTSNTNKNKLK